MDAPDFILDGVDPDEVAAAAEMEIADAVFEEALETRPATDDELHAFIELFYGYRIPRVAVCTDLGHVSPFQALADAFFNRYPNKNALWTGGRGSGKTLPFAILEHISIHFNGDEVVNVGAIEAQAERCYSYITEFSGKQWFKPFLTKPPMISKSFWKNGGKLEILPGTKRAVNGPHPRMAMLDEVDLFDWAVLQEAWNMAITRNGLPPQIVLTSSLKFAYGPMIRLMDEAEKRAIKPYTWCVFESIERCPPTRHKDGEGCMTCPLARECLYSTVTPDGEISLLPGPGRAAHADGFRPIDEVIMLYAGLDTDTWDSQMRSKRPSSRGLVYPMFGDHHIIEYEWNPALPVYGGLDFGFTNPSAFIAAQLTPDGELVFFDEIVVEGTLDEHLARLIRAKPYFANLQWTMGDPAAAQSRATMRHHGVEVTAADNTKDTSKDSSGISKMRWLLAPPGSTRPRAFVDKRCVNLIRGFRTYHVADEKDDRNMDEKPVKHDDHALDGARYIVARIVKTTRAS